MKKLNILISIVALSCTALTYASSADSMVKRIISQQNNATIKKEREIIDNNEAFRFNLNLVKSSPDVYKVVNDILRKEQLDEIKVVLQKIVNNQEELLKIKR